MDSKTGYAVILVTTGSSAEAERIAGHLVEEGLAACVNIVGPIRSIYRWQGELQREAEHLLIIKSSAAIFAPLAARIRELHSYDIPEVIALPIDDGSAPYLQWLGSSIK
jgi:periplasmic divalent cation tolerance protein